MIEGLQQLVEAIGLESALRVIVAWGGSTLYVPDKFDPDHLITKVLGEDAAIKFELVYGGQTLAVPKVNMGHIKLEVNVIKLLAKGFSPREAGHILGISKERAKQIADKHCGAVKVSKRSTAQMKNPIKKPGDPAGQAGCGSRDPRNPSSAKTPPTSYQAAEAILKPGGRHGVE